MRVEAWEGRRASCSDFSVTIILLAALTEVPYLNYKTVWEQISLPQWLINNLVVGVAAATAVTLTSALVAFGFAPGAIGRLRSRLPMRCYRRGSP